MGICRLTGLESSEEISLGLGQGRRENALSEGAGGLVVAESTLGHMVPNF